MAAGEEVPEVVIVTIRYTPSEFVQTQIARVYDGSRVTYVPIEPTNPQEVIDLVERVGAKHVLLRPDPLPRAGLDAGISFLFPGSTEHLFELEGVDVMSREWGRS